MRSAIASPAPTVGLNYIMAELGRDEMSDRWQVRFAALLIAQAGFPPQLPDMKGGRLVGLNTHSRWPRAAVDLWLRGQLPPDTADALDGQRQRAANDDMDGAAELLAAGITARHCDREVWSL